MDVKVCAICANEYLEGRNEPIQVYVVATESGRIMWHTFSLWEDRSIAKFCPREQWESKKKVGYQVRRMFLADTTIQLSVAELRKRWNPANESLSG